jgi:hypothetical protein
MEGRCDEECRKVLRERTAHPPDTHTLIASKTRGTSVLQLQEIKLCTHTHTYTHTHTHTQRE